MSVAAGCIESDDASMIAAAKAGCMRLARDHLARAGSEQVTFADTPNVSSDPEPNVFEFLWRANDLSGVKRNAELLPKDIGGV